ncbi:HTH-type transcriptional regulator SgrR [Vibrio thalassae]|uniref:HTH-type transcriptional regulator SgrR n=1 Tax=Vibrio thalassae TaxID=1243014 RepID=A0A240EI77_9VIBR|nr:SgrR family transcriptional regulator [Vibrio thalassae]SNX48211.1 HTH-type transcriptional regulator SgrR [Vibrio thalassae]
MAADKRKLELYENLFKQLGPGEHCITIGTIADYFQCSERHSRTLLKQMQTKQWLSWNPARGRGLRGTLVCLQEPIDACYKEVERATVKGNYDMAHKLIGFNDRNVASGLKQYLTHATTASEDTIFAPFHRTLSWLHPHHTMERTERHLIHEVFQTLVNLKGSELTGGISHAWESDDNKTLWTFYLRSGVFFHDQSPVTTSDVVESLKALTVSPYWRALYDHIADINSHTANQIQITLKHSDPHLPKLLSRAEASIMPKQFIYRAERHFKPIGSGPFVVEVSSEKLLRLKRNPTFSGQSALVEHIELWIHKEWAEDKKCAENFFFLSDEQVQYTAATSDIGYFFLLINNKSLQNECFQNSLERLFNGQLDAPIPCDRHIDFCFENNNENRWFSRKLTSALKQQGITSVGTQVVYGHPAAKQDLAIGGIRLEGDRTTSLLAFFKLYPYWQANLTWKQQDHLKQTLSVVRSEVDTSKQKQTIDELLTWLHNNRVLTIIRSEDLSLSIPSRIRGVEINSIGWCDFSKLWIKQRMTPSH